MSRVDPGRLVSLGRRRAALARWTSRRAGGAARAFTLVEMLLASALAAVVGLAIAQVVSVAHRADARVRDRGARRSVEGGLARRLDADLRALVPPGGLYASGLVLLPALMTGAAEALVPAGLEPPAPRAGLGDADLAAPPVDARDQLTLAVAPPPAAFGDALPPAQGAFAQVVWEIDDDPATAERGLVRRAVRLRDPLPGATPEPADVIDPDAVGLEVRCFDGTSWTDAWDSGASETLPRLVQVRVARVAAGALSTVIVAVAPLTARVGDGTTTDDAAAGAAQ